MVDRKVYDVTGDIQASFGTIGDVLSAIPSVDVDPDGIVSLRGDSNVLILIDGKPSALLSGSKAGDNLRSIPARDIERIEVLPTPPAQFKAEGVAGVINIIMRKKRPEGVAGSVLASIGDSGRMVAGADGSYHAGSLTAAVNAGFRRDTRQRTLGSAVNVFGAPSKDPATEVSLLSEHAHRQIPTASAKAEYEIDDRQSVSAALSWLGRGGPRTYTQVNTSSSADEINASTERLSSGHDPETEFDQRLGYTRRFEREGEELEFTAHRSKAAQREHYDYSNHSFVPAAPSYRNSLSLIEDHETTELGADYTLPLPKDQNFKLGYAFEASNFRYGELGATVDPASGIETIDPGGSNDFRYQLQINAAYASYQAKAESWNLLAGLRAELTEADLSLLTDNISTHSSYFEIYPSLHVTRTLSESSTLFFGAGRRIKRPDPDDLNPYIDHEYTPNLRAGNADLKPQLTQSYELGYGYEGAKSSLQLTGYYRLNRNSTTEVTQNLGNGISLTTKTNLPKNDSAGIEATANGHLLPALAYSLSANPFYTQIDSAMLVESGLKSTTGINVKLKLDFQPRSSDSLQLMFTRNDKRLTPQGYVSATNIVNIGYRHQTKFDLTAIATVSDALNGQQTDRILTTPTYSGSYFRIVKGRVVYVGLIYTFGSAKTADPFDYDQ